MSHRFKKGDILFEEHRKCVIKELVEYIPEIHPMPVYEIVYLDTNAGNWVSEHFLSEKVSMSESLLDKKLVDLWKEDLKDKDTTWNCECGAGFTSSPYAHYFWCRSFRKW